MMITLKCIKIANHYAVYQEITQCCGSNKLTNSQKKRSDLYLPQARTEEGEFDEDRQKAQTKITKYQGCNVQHDKNN